MRFGHASPVVLAALLFGAGAGAHEGGVDARGTVKEITPDRLVLSSAAGTEVTVTLAAGTRILRGKRPVGVADIKRGERAVVHAAQQGAILEATEVRLAEPARSTAK
jgi:hypothetical protein